MNTRTKIDKLLKYCNGCAHLSLAEWQQNEIYKETGERPPHICNYYKKQVKHYGHHPSIVRLGNCTAYAPMSPDDPKWQRNQPVSSPLLPCDHQDKTALDASITGHFYHCPTCDIHLTSLGLCPECGVRYELPQIDRFPTSAPWGEPLDYDWPKDE